MGRGMGGMGCIERRAKLHTSNIVFEIENNNFANWSCLCSESVSSNGEWRRSKELSRIDISQFDLVRSHPLVLILLTRSLSTVQYINVSCS